MAHCLSVKPKSLRRCFDDARMFAAEIEMSDELVRLQNKKLAKTSNPGAVNF
jgi:hypothetical protein